MIQLVLILLLGIFVLFAVAWLVAATLFTGKDHSEYDLPRHASTGTRTRESVEHEDAADAIAKGLAEPAPAKGKELLHLMRRYLDERGEAAKINSEIRPIDAAGVKAEWIIAPNAEASRRLLTNPRSPLISPLQGDLSNLPPTLLQASEAEMFLDDSIRYANKANAQGSHAEVQTWPFLMHVWHAFEVPEADEAFESIKEFLGEHAAKSEAHTN